MTRRTGIHADSAPPSARRSARNGATERAETTQNPALVAPAETRAELRNGDAPAYARIPRLVVAAPSSASGKTTVVCALLSLFAARFGAERTAAFKIGPDFIDPLFHAHCSGVRTGNLDLFFTDESAARALFARSAAGARIAVLEGAMGLFDGVGGTTAEASAAHTARALGAPVVLVVDARGAALSVCAAINGMKSFATDSRESDWRGCTIGGVILNRCKPHVHDLLAPAIRAECGVPVLGYLPDDPDFAIGSRHLGLLTPDAVADLDNKMVHLARAATHTLDLDAIIALADSAAAFVERSRNERTGTEENSAPVAPAESSAPHRNGNPPADTCGASTVLSNRADSAPPFARSSARNGANERAGANRDAAPGNPPPARSSCTIAVARDAAFCFYYRENLALLEQSGARLAFFSPLADEPVPAEACALYLGGGYPELFPAQLAGSRRTAASVRAFARGGAPVLAECGGFLYLQLLGILPGTFANAGHLVRFGYAELTANEDTFLCRAGEKIRAHEFHYFDTTENGAAFTAQKRSGASWACVQSAAPVGARPSPCQQRTEKNIVAGFPHLYFPSNPRFAENFVGAALTFASLRDMGAAGRPGCGGCGTSTGCPGCAAHGATPPSGAAENPAPVEPVETSAVHGGGSSADEIPLFVKQNQNEFTSDADSTKCTKCTVSANDADSARSACDLRGEACDGRT